MRKSLDELKFRPDTTTNSRVICPCASEKLVYNVVNTLAPTISIGSTSFLQVTRTTIVSYEFEIRPDRSWTKKLAALERLKKKHYRLIM